MPKIVDHDQRRHEIAAAMWRVLYRDGIEGVNIRSVAAEAGLSKATLAHYFDGQNDLLLFAMAESISKVATQLRSQGLEHAELPKFVAAACQIVPTTATRREQSEIWLALVSRAQADPKLRASLSEVNTVVAEGISELLHMMQSAGLVSPKRDLPAETTRLHALVDGLTLHTLTDPVAVSPAAIKSVIRLQLTELAAAP